ncbi:IS701 family transposase [Streptomyces sp. NPDC051018]|uniref:IS701 family transposase n=1 Tax=Streptomyces sp. NPDC051018 TaxID=3365639 RepID=UPI003791DFDB
MPALDTTQVAAPEAALPVDAASTVSRAGPARSRPLPHSPARPSRHSTESPRFQEFAEEVFGHLPRADQRRWAAAYLRGLLTTPGKKSVRRLAAAVSSSPTASHSLQQFLNASPWDWAPVRAELAVLAGRRGPVRAWSVATAVVPKRGEHSVGVHKSFIPAAGRVLNCQQGVGLFFLTAGEALPVDWRLLLPKDWALDVQRRQRARIPPSVGHEPLSAYALDLIDTATSAGPRPRPPIVADLSGPGDCADASALVNGLLARGQAFVVTVPGSLPVVPMDGRRAGGGPASGAREFLRRCSLRHPATMTLSGRRGEPTLIRIASGVVRLPPSSRWEAVGVQDTLRLFRAQDSARIWATNLVHCGMDDLLGLARLQSRTAHALGDMATDYGLLDFEGRSFPGWHHHMTLVSAAYAYGRLNAAPAPGGSSTDPMGTAA